MTELILESTLSNWGRAFKFQNSLSTPCRLSDKTAGEF